MAAVKISVSLCLLVLCTCRPTENELPHSRDFYAGYIKALNDNFDVLFKPERQTRSISSSEERGNDAEEEKRAEVLEELIDKNPQKRDDAESMDMHKREILSDDIMNTNTETGLGESSNTETVIQSPIRIKKEVVEHPTEITSNINIANSSSVKSEIFNKVKEEDSDDVSSGEKKTIDEKDYNLDSENDSEDIASGAKKTIEGNSEDLASGGKVTNSEDTSSGDDGSANISDDASSGSKKTIVKMYTSQVEGETDFEEKSHSNGEGKSEKREIRNIADDNSSNEVTSGDKTTAEENDEDVGSAKDEDGDDDDNSGDTITTVDTITGQKRNITIQDDNHEVNENEKVETSSEKRSKLEGTMTSNKAIAQVTLKNVTTENANNINGASETQEKEQDNKKKNILAKNIDKTESKVENDDDVEVTAVEEEEGKKIVDDENIDNNPPVKSTLLNEDDKDDDSVQKKTVLYAADDSNQINKKTVYREENEDDDRFKKPSYHVVVGSKKTIVPSNTSVSITPLKNITTDPPLLPSSPPQKARRKFKVKHHHHEYTPEKEENEISDKRVEEDTILPDAFTTEGEEDEDKELINAPEPTYMSQIPGLETSTIERFSDEGQESGEDRGLSDRINYQSPMMFYSRNPYSRNDYEDLRRHFILEHASMQHLPYMPGIMSGFTEEQEERNMSPGQNMVAPDNNMITHENNLMPDNGIQNGNMFLPTENSIINEHYNSGLPPSNQDVVSYRPSPYYNQYQQQPQSQFNGGPMEQMQYVDQYSHGLEDNPQGYIPQSAAQAPASTRSIVMDKRHRQYRPDDSIIRVPSNVVDRFIQNAAQIYQFGDELVRHSPALMENTHTGITRSSVSSRRKSHEPVILQPIVVLMPYGRKK